MKGWIASHKVLSAIIVLLVLIGIGAAAGGSSNKSVNNKAASTGANSSNTASHTSSSVAHIGSVIDLGGSKGLAITAQQIIDPAQSDNQYASPDPGKRFVAVKLQITNNGTGAYSDDANNNVALIGSDNQSYTADFDTITGCTNFSSGQYNLGSGSSATGCVVFQVPNGITPAKVQFTSQSGLSGKTAEWTVQ